MSGSGAASDHWIDQNVKIEENLRYQAQQKKIQQFYKRAEKGFYIARTHKGVMLQEKEEILEFDTKDEAWTQLFKYYKGIVSMDEMSNKGCTVVYIDIPNILKSLKVIHNFTGYIPFYDENPGYINSGQLVELCQTETGDEAWKKISAHYDDILSLKELQTAGCRVEKNIPENISGMLFEEVWQKYVK